MAKYLYDQREPHTETYKGFYGMRRNSIDVVIVGTSHSAAAFNPQDLYDKAQIRSYNLSSSAQTVWNSYYWVKEASRYHDLSAVIFDCNYLFSTYVYEAAARKTLDNMKPGLVKYEAAKVNVGMYKNGTQSVLSYFLPLIRYHSRWKELNANQHQRACIHDSGHVQKANHTWDKGKVTKNPTTSAVGIRTYTCTACKATKTEKIAKLKKANPLKIAGKTATVKYSKLKKKAQTLRVGKVIKFTKKGRGKLTYAKVSGNKKITINKKTGKVTVKKGLKNGTYKVTVKVEAAGNAGYKAATRKVSFKVRVK
jgi:hypothetical protein